MPRPIRNKPETKSTTEFDVALGGRVKEIRLNRDLSQKKLGSMVGVTYQQISKYEDGTNRMSVYRLLRICDALKYGVDRMLDNLRT